MEASIRKLYTVPMFLTNNMLNKIQGLLKDRTVHPNYIEYSFRKSKECILYLIDNTLIGCCMWKTRDELMFDLSHIKQTHIYLLCTLPEHFGIKGEIIRDIEFANTIRSIALYPIYAEDVEYYTGIGFTMQRDGVHSGLLIKYIK
jgi:hypothetical protein